MRIASLLISSLLLTSCGFGDDESSSEPKETPEAEQTAQRQLEETKDDVLSADPIGLEYRMDALDQSEGSGWLTMVSHRTGPGTWMRGRLRFSGPSWLFEFVSQRSRDLLGLEVPVRSSNLCWVELPRPGLPRAWQDVRLMPERVVDAMRALQATDPAQSPYQFDGRLPLTQALALLWFPPDGLLSSEPDGAGIPVAYSNPGDEASVPVTVSMNPGVDLNFVMDGADVLRLVESEDIELPHSWSMKLEDRQFVVNTVSRLPSDKPEVDRVEDDVRNCP